MRRTVKFHAAEIDETLNNPGILESLAPAVSYELDKSLSPNLRKECYLALKKLKRLTPHLTNISAGPVDRGARGEIWTAHYEGEMVALKRMKDWVLQDKRRGDRHFARELTSWARLDHVNILKLYGVCELGPVGLAMVSPWMEHGNIMDYLATHEEANRSLLLLDIAEALNYLHTTFNPPMIHGDLKAENVFVDSFHHARVADFGLTGTRPDVPENLLESMSVTLGNERWKAPELLLPEDHGLTMESSFLPAGDVYAFGMVIYEIYTGLKPFCHIRNYVSIPISIAGGERPPRPSLESDATKRGLCDEMWDIAHHCWRGNWKERPSAPELIRRIRSNISSEVQVQEEHQVNSDVCIVTEGRPDEQLSLRLENVHLTQQHDAACVDHLLLSGCSHRRSGSLGGNSPPLEALSLAEHSAGDSPLPQESTVNLPPTSNSSARSIDRADHARRSLAFQLRAGKNLTPYITNISEFAVADGSSSYIRMGRLGYYGVALKTRPLDLAGDSESQRLATLRFVEELKIWQLLKHPSILELDGFYEYEGEQTLPALVSPWMNYGNIGDYLLHHLNVNRLALLYDIALGLSYLHGSLDVPIVHHNLQARNILIRPNGQACLTGFSEARFQGDLCWRDNMVTAPVNARWMAPERLYPERYGMTLQTSNTPAVDIYSFGMVIYEIYTGQKPFYRVQNDLRIPGLIFAGARPPYPDQEAARMGLREEVWDMAEDCWREERENRPTAKELVERVVAAQWNPLDPPKFFGQRFNTFVARAL
ncbi:kinase-like protein [Calocera viscosa TUFC12733]|uniref:Kinase-like protein n=1 Tax=Calocera viscosa (strain TUFC12733) TaxID=1330018 RepID=A0A167PQX9_CALVF|nr:kinase-like protein [Calocera viscosa TUFC12733]